ncbi:flagellar biosynthesis protein FlhB [Dyella sp.]|uniref:flagellar biosynthesis protein FlhB n=1 Tax=Dyella sp. TaxID=1869338 RepID=UPI002ED4F4B6
MADQEQEDRTEQPSEKRIREAREKGDVPRSRDLSGALVTLGAMSALVSTGPSAMEHMRTIYRLGLSYSRDALFSGNLAGHAFYSAAHEAIAIVAPVAAATVLAAVAAPTLLGGLNFSAEALQPKFERLDPISGLGKIFAMRGLVELGKSLLKLVLIGAALVILMRNWQPEMMQTGRGVVGVGIAQSISLLGRAGLVFGVILALLGGVDALWQRFDYGRRQRMTKQELRDEHKEQEGSPELKGRIRQVQQQMSRRRMMQELPKADVVITNPTHFAVALQYDDGRMRAPKVIAKGVDVLALQIRHVAAGHRIPTVEAPPLARALYATTDIGREVPAALYVAVAQVLAYVYQVKQALAHGVSPPEPPRPDVDPELMGPYRDN